MNYVEVTCQSQLISHFQNLAFITNMFRPAWPSSGIASFQNLVFITAWLVTCRYKYQLLKKKWKYSCEWPVTSTYFMLCWPCFSIHPCNENQLDVLFILSLFRKWTSTCFGHICSPSPVGILCLYIHNNWYMLCRKDGCLKLFQRIYISL